MDNFLKKWASCPRLLLALSLLTPAFFPGALNAKPPPELTNLINLYERQKRALEITAIIGNLRKLRELEETLNKADYKEDGKLVRAVIDERQRRMNTLIRAAATAPLPVVSKVPKGKRPTIYLKAPQAKLSGSLQKSFRQISNWSSTNCSANWSLTGIIPGRYHIQVSYVPVSGGGGEIQVRELDQLIRTRVPAASREKRFKRSIRVGTLNLRQSINLEIRPTESNGRGIFVLTEVQLIPAG